MQGLQLADADTARQCIPDDCKLDIADMLRRMADAAAGSASKIDARQLEGLSDAGSADAVTSSTRSSRSEDANQHACDRKLQRNFKEAHQLVAAMHVMQACASAASAQDPYLNVYADAPVFETMHEWAGATCAVPTPQQDPAQRTSQASGQVADTPGAPLTPQPPSPAPPQPLPAMHTHGHAAGPTATAALPRPQSSVQAAVAATAHTWSVTACGRVPSATATAHTAPEPMPSDESGVAGVDCDGSSGISGGGGAPGADSSADLLPRGPFELSQSRMGRGQQPRPAEAEHHLGGMHAYEAYHPDKAAWGAADREAHMPGAAHAGQVYGAIKEVGAVGGAPYAWPPKGGHLQPVRNPAGLDRELFDCNCEDCVYGSVGMHAGCASDEILKLLKDDTSYTMQLADDIRSFDDLPEEGILSGWSEDPELERTCMWDTEEPPKEDPLDPQDAPLAMGYCGVHACARLDSAASTCDALVAGAADCEPEVIPAPEMAEELDGSDDEKEESLSFELEEWHELCPPRPHSLSDGHLDELELPVDLELKHGGGLEHKNAPLPALQAWELRGVYPTTRTAPTMSGCRCSKLRFLL